MTDDRRYPSGGKRAPKIDQWRGVGSFGTIGLEIVLSIAFGFFGGRWLDEKFDTAPYGAGIGFFFGLAAAINSVMRAHREMQRLAEREEREQGNPRPIYDARDDERKNDSIKSDAPASSDDDDDDDGDEDKSGKAKR